VKFGGDQRWGGVLEHKSDNIQTPIAINSGTGEATDFKFSWNIHRVYPNTNPLKILEKRVTWVYPRTAQIF